MSFENYVRWDGIRWDGTELNGVIGIEEGVGIMVNNIVGGGDSGSFVKLMAGCEGHFNIPSSLGDCTCFFGVKCLMLFDPISLSIIIEECVWIWILLSYIKSINKNINNNAIVNDL
ncbi:hypothetical protein PHYBLDRAFT_174855 [Phycomyces blakesleeanus NRRL 1555(-)]|uniref:Uncharacterized protein n=1 Tax=Phycomyces blakesleeanus (strain ATCC 8743b / DSM 1359 / FGSC 10004 / NBRC 33097 / NRRL 1555) TaxID=763407 RepID=A0A162T835_PHYB8|nr:hypothetical protein PHYBLDRAFT_174855 [Phycomyces blakesleeanus NRRL 1555(-)]OAD66832.1 hypothetical protein PHYBLDRAFT_174855 [Phycomyces blakesleeanus NRRL 1555(-)]|eukprot:XP_018284872.1 hypothetical protein PHYBLDRAFT_174855 [Phycomyces blakesleeanus NRRL 1555(-)]